MVNKLRTAEGRVPAFFISKAILQKRRTLNLRAGKRRVEKKCSFIIVPNIVQKKTVLLITAFLHALSRHCGPY